MGPVSFTGSPRGAHDGDRAPPRHLRVDRRGWPSVKRIRATLTRCGRGRLDIARRGRRMLRRDGRAQRNPAPICTGRPRMTAPSGTLLADARERAPAGFTLLSAARLIDGGDGAPVTAADLLLDADHVVALGPRGTVEAPA